MGPRMGLKGEKSILNSRNQAQSKPAIVGINRIMRRIARAQGNQAAWQAAIAYPEAGVLFFMKQKCMPASSILFPQSRVASANARQASRNTRALGGVEAYRRHRETYPANAVREFNKPLLARDLVAALNRI